MNTDEFKSRIELINKEINLLERKIDYEKKVTEKIEKQVEKMDKRSVVFNVSIFFAGIGELSVVVKFIMNYFAVKF